jgi:hypothetical protein
MGKDAALQCLLSILCGIDITREGGVLGGIYP